MVLVHCTSSHCAWPLYEIVLKSNQYFTSYTPDKVTSYTPDKEKNTKGNNSVITLDRVTVLVHCTPTYCGWPLYEIVLKSNLYFSSYAPDKEK